MKRLLTAALVFGVTAPVMAQKLDSTVMSDTLQWVVPDAVTTTDDYIESIVKGTLFPALRKIDPCPKGAVHEIDTGHCNIAIGIGAGNDLTWATGMILIGRCSGTHLKNARRGILIGDYTSAPENSNGFVNIANKLCWWRDTGGRVDCPAPEPECVK